MRRRADIQFSAIAVGERTRMLQHVVRLTEQVTTCGYQLGTLRSQPQAPSHMIEKPNTKLTLQILQLAGEGGLRNTQCLCRAGDSSLFSHNNKCAQSLEVHCPAYDQKASIY